MNNRYVPLAASLVTAAILVGTWLYTYYATASSTPRWVAWLILIAIAVATFVGILAAVRLPITPVTKIVYIIGAALILVSVASFYIFTAPTTINIAGFLGVIIGMIVAVVAGLFIPKSLRG